ncbi:hypothetical protein GCM10009554_29100 [Kribbella koreensis]|uniref:DUF4232 domain-containing protein n=1 Tax=Kribbella koreensis TaxID=57909 RepID=A0ABN1Q974_9ACTN
MPKRGLIIGGLALFAVAAGAVQCVGADQGPTQPDQLAFSYRRIGGEGYMDQVLTIVNGGPTAAVPTLEITPLDPSGTPVLGITVGTAYGSDRGKVLVPTAGDATDVLIFHGADVARISDVRVSVRDMVTPDYPRAPVFDDPQPRDDSGTPTTKSGPFSAFTVINPNRGQISLGVVCIIWNQPFDGQPQEVLEATTLGVATVAGRDTATIPVPASAQQARTRGCGSLKAYLAAPALAG